MKTKLFRCVLSAALGLGTLSSVAWADGRYDGPREEYRERREFREHEARERREHERREAKERERREREWREHERRERYWNYRR
jgi:hypothetical protein